MTATRIPQPSTATTVADILRDLGDIPPNRVRIVPPIGKATLEDLIEANERGDGPVCEWVESTLVEKAVGHYESWIGSIVNGLFLAYIRMNRRGMLLGEDGAVRILPGVGRAADVAFVAWSSMSGGKPPPPEDRIPAMVPDLVVEVLSACNTPREMEVKRRQYFTAGVKHVWEIDPIAKTAKAFTGIETVCDIPVGGTITAENVLPGFTLSLAEVFDLAAPEGGTD